MQNVEFGVVWGVRGDPRSLAMSSFDKAPMTSYLTLTELCIYLVLFSSFSNLSVESRLF